MDVKCITDYLSSVELLARSKMLHNCVLKPVLRRAVFLEDVGD